jgi:hypothetical protein
MQNEVANLLQHWVLCGGYHEFPDLSLRRSSLLQGGLWWALSFWWVLRVPRRMAAKWWRWNFWRTMMDGNGDELDGMSARLLWEAYGPRDVFEALLRTMEGRSFGDCFWKRFWECAWEASSLVVSRAFMSFRVSSLLRGMVEGFLGKGTCSRAS